MSNGEERRSIEAYDFPERVVSYDADMDLMHPNRAEMVEIALEVLPFDPLADFMALDLAARGKSRPVALSISRIICKKILQYGRTGIKC